MLRKNRGCCPIHLTNEEKREEEEEKKFRIVTAFQAAIVDDIVYLYMFLHNRKIKLTSIPAT